MGYMPGTAPWNNMLRARIVHHEDLVVEQSNVTIVEVEVHGKLILKGSNIRIIDSIIHGGIDYDYDRSRLESYEVQTVRKGVRGIWDALLSNVHR